MKDEKSSTSKPTKKLVFINKAKIIHELEVRVRELEQQLEQAQSKQRIADLERHLYQAKTQKPTQNSKMDGSSLFFSANGDLTQLLSNKAKQCKNELSDELIKQFFQSIYLRDFEKLEYLLIRYPNLVHAMSSAPDATGVECTHVTGFQYAICLRDFQVWSLMVNTPTITNRLSDINIKHQFLAYLHERRDLTQRTSVFQAIEDLCHELTLFSENFHHWSHFQASTHWLDLVSKAQKSLPNWIIYPMMEEGCDVAWMTQDFTIPIKYNPYYLQKWSGDNQCQLGNEDLKQAFAWCRGKNPQPSKNLAYCLSMGTGMAVEYDERCISILSKQAEDYYKQLVEFCSGVSIEDIVAGQTFVLEMKQDNIHTSTDDSYFTRFFTKLFKPFNHTFK